MKASLKNYRQSPRKVRLVADLVKKKSVPKALDILKHTTKRAAPTVQKLIESATANAEQAGLQKENLIVENITVDKGIVLKRYMPRAMGSSYQILKRTSHVNVTLGTGRNSKKNVAPKAEKAPATKTIAPKTKTPRATKNK
jgi:large subunit ribosomal protein L22